MTEPLPLSITVRGEEPDWVVSETLKDKNISMNIVARIVINGDIANDPNDIVHAYGDGHETLGVTHVNVDNTAGSNEALTYIIVYSPDGQSKALNFEYYDASTGRIYQLEPADAVFTGGRFTGSFSPVSFTANDKTVLFIGSNNKLHWPSSDVTMGSCRAYFSMNVNMESREIVTHFDDDGTTSVENINRESIANNQYYTLDGRKLEGKPTTQGIYIHQGRKVVIKREQNRIDSSSAECERVRSEKTKEVVK